MAIALTIAGSDSSGGAGIQADLKTFTVLRTYGASVITSLTAQNTLGVTGIQDVPPEFVLEQLRAVLEDVGADAMKTGMLSQAAIVQSIAPYLSEWRKKHPNVALIIDPVMVAKSGHHLLQPNAVEIVKHMLFPEATLLTPNMVEAEFLTGLTIDSNAEAISAAESLLEIGPQAVLLKAGHFQSNSQECNDLFMDRQGRREYLPGRRLDQRHTHGTGCTLSAAITAFTARGMELLEACRAAKQFIQGAIEHAQPLGHGTGPVNHLWEK